MLAPNTLLQDRYLIMRLLGQGGMGAVYQATDRKFGNAVALKETFYSDTSLRKAFSQEARLLNRLRHAALPVVTDYFSISEKQFLVMQFIPGKDLEQLLNERSASEQGVFLTTQVVRWADQLLDALEYLHSQKPQIIHRDIKPQNLKLTPRGEVILLDFGLAKGVVTHPSHDSQSIRGYTPNYASLEQIRGTGTDSRSDIYSMGATLYHLLTGEMPPDALTRIAAILMGQPDPLRRISDVNREVTPMVSAVIEKAMSPHPAQRYLTAAAMRHALRNAAQNISPTNVHRVPTLTDEPVTSMARDAEAASAMLATPAGAAPAVTEELSARMQERQSPPQPASFSSQQAGGPREEQVIILLDEARQKLEGKKEEVVRKQTPRHPGEARKRKATANEASREAPKRAITLTGASGRAVSYGVAAMVLMILTIGILTYRSREVGRDLLAGAADLVNTTQANVAGSTLAIPIRVEALRYHIEITGPNGDIARDTGLMPLPVGSRFKFHFKMRQDGYLYIIARGKDGAPQTFLTAQPMASSGVTTNWSNSGKDYQFPDGGQWLMLQRDADAAPFTVLYSQSPLQAPAFLAEPSGHELTPAEQQELQAFRQRYAGYKPDLMVMEDGNQPAVVVQMPAEVRAGEPLIFDIAVKRK
ncbi:MAG: protein kinase domain-containing protein [Blastocatellia bacterium]